MKTIEKKVSTKKKVFVANDGTEFDYAIDCCEYEDKKIYSGVLSLPKDIISVFNESIKLKKDILIDVNCMAIKGIEVKKSLKNIFYKLAEYSPMIIHQNFLFVYNFYEDDGYSYARYKLYNINNISKIKDIK